MVFLRKNILIVLLVFIVIVGYIFFQTKQTSLSLVTPSMGIRSYDSGGMSGVAFQEKMTSDIALPIVPQEPIPQPNVSNRMVIQNSYLSLLVVDVSKVREDILSYIQGLGGYMVSSDSNGTEDSLSSTLVIRVPQEQLDTVLSTVRSYGLRVVSEHLDGQDITDQFVDIQKRISILEQTMSQYEDLRSKSKEISDLTNITREILNIQSQIDNYKGQQELLEKSAQYTKITVYLSRDEIALPYKPDDNFRPQVIFKLAVRSLMTSLRSLLASLIWVAVYGVVWIPILIVIFLVYKKMKQ